MVKFDFISDLHLDSYLEYGGTPAAFMKRISIENPANTLLIAGDIGHNHDENIEFFKIAKQYYKEVVYVAGNHDLWIIDRFKPHQKFKHSLAKLNEFKNQATKVGVKFLQDEYVTIEGKKIYGNIGVFDYSYGIKNLNIKKEILAKNFEKMPDYRYTKWEPDYDWEQHIDKIKTQMSNVDFDTDIILTHYCPDIKGLDDKYMKDYVTSYYYFDNETLIKRLTNAIWIYGHTHTKCEFEKHHTKFYVNPLGYCGEFDSAASYYTPWHLFDDGLYRKINQIEI